MSNLVTIDGNEAVARIAYAASEVIAIYPITPASPMGEIADVWAAAGRPNALGTVPTVIEMQSEGGAAGTLHGALQGGALATTFTASQGLLLMLPNMFKIAGELTAGVMHVAARSLATHALSIFGDHSDVMAARTTGWAMLASASPQEAHDLALVSHMATLKARVPFMHFMDGFRTSHEINKLAVVSDEDVRRLLDPQAIAAHRARALDPDQPVLRGTAQNPDVFFQAREACNPFYAEVGPIVQQAMDELAELTGRRYSIMQYTGHPQATRVVVMMGSGCGAAREAVQQLVAQGEQVGLVQVRLYRPFEVANFMAALPRSVRHIAVLDRTKEPGSIGEPLYLDVVAAIHEAWPADAGERPRILGGRYGLSSKEFTPAMVLAIFDLLAAPEARRHFTVGIRDDVTRLSLEWDESQWQEPDDVIRAVFFGLGSDGTVGANKNSVKIIGEQTNLHAQGYFVYDSKKAGAVTVSHLRFSPRPIESTYLIRQANFVACHQFDLLHKLPVIDVAAPGATLLLNSPYAGDQLWEHLLPEVQQQIIERQLRVVTIDAQQLATQLGLGGRINTIMQTCFFALSDILPREEAIAKIKAAIQATYAKRGLTIVQRNFEAVDAAVAGLQAVDLPAQVRGERQRPLTVPNEAPDFVQRVTRLMLEGRGELLPVSALPIDGTFPTGTAQYEKRSIALQIPIWDAELCIECGLCALVCPHAAIRSKRYAADDLVEAPAGWQHRINSRESELGVALTIQVAPDDCTGCGICVDVCPAKSKQVVRHKAINMLDKDQHAAQERANFQFFQSLPDVDRCRVKTDTVKGSQLLLPVFEYSGACAGCGETPYLKLLSQLFGDRCLIANATGCSSIFGGNLPTTPWAKDAQGRGPAWSNSLFEDNAEFGLGLRLAVDSKLDRGRYLLRQLRDAADSPLNGAEGELMDAILNCRPRTEREYADQRGRLQQLSALLEQRTREAEPASGQAALIGELQSLLAGFASRSLWIVGGDGWAYDIGFGGLDHVLASGRDVNILVLDTGVYSNTGGQASKATPRGAAAKFAAQGRASHRKDLGMMAIAYGSAYVAQVAMGANPAQCIRAFHDAESFPGPSLILAYSHCIAHGIDMSVAMSHQKDLVRSGFWPLYRYDPRQAVAGEHPFHLDSHPPNVPFKEVAMREGRFAMLARSQPEHAAELLALAQRDIDDTWHYYQQMAGVQRDWTDAVVSDGVSR